VTEMGTKSSIRIVDLLIETHAMIVIERRLTTATGLLMTAKENFLDSHPMILLETNPREIILTNHGLISIEMGLTINDVGWQTVIDVILVTVETLIPSIGLKIWIDGFLQNLRKMSLILCIVLLKIKDQIMVKQWLLAMVL